MPVQAIELKGIVHNTTKIGVKDGQSEDIVNLRFKDGSWRSTGDGEVILTGLNNYSQMFIHTNVYRHLLAVNQDGVLCWIGSSKKSDPTQFDKFPAGQDVPITQTTGTVSICQTGHMITVIDGEDNFEYFVFKTSSNIYKKVVVENSKEQTATGIYPFGNIHFNLAKADPITRSMKGEEGWGIWRDEGTDRFWDASDKCPKMDMLHKIGTRENCHNVMIDMYAQAQKKNVFTDPFLAVAAIKLYDGSFVYASNPVLLYPRESQVSTHPNSITYDPTDDTNASDINRIRYNSIEEDDITSIDSDCAYVNSGHFMYKSGSDSTISFGTPVQITDEVGVTRGGYKFHKVKQCDKNLLPVFSNGAETNMVSLSGVATIGGSYWSFEINGCHLCVSLDTNVLSGNEDVFTSICVFVTRQSRVYEMSADEDSIGDIVASNVEMQDGNYTRCSANASYAPKKRHAKHVIRDLMTSEFFLLKEYSKSTINQILGNPVILLDDAEDVVALQSVENASRETLSIESTSRMSYIPKVVYNYNGRLHIANYKSYQYHGYPLTSFVFNNHMVLHNSSGETGYLFDTLKDLELDYDFALQFKRDIFAMPNDVAAKAAGMPWVIVRTTIETDDGNQVVSRYLPFSNTGVKSIEDLGPIISFPDYRAVNMMIFCVEHVASSSPEPKYAVKGFVFDLKPHAYLNLAYHITADIEPIRIDKEFENGQCLFKYLEANNVDFDPSNPQFVESE